MIQKAIILFTTGIFLFNTAFADLSLQRPLSFFQKSSLRPTSSAKATKAREELRTSIFRHTCANCGKKIPPLETGYRGHCLHCLWSRHLDDRVPGDRQSECLGMMKPIGAEHNSKKGWMILYQCQECGATISNKASRDDDWDAIITLSQPDRRGMKTAASAAAKARTLKRLIAEVTEGEPTAQETTAVLKEREAWPDSQAKLKLARLLNGDEEFSLQDVIGIIRDCPEEGPGSVDPWLTLFKMREFEPEETVMTLTALACAAKTPGLFSRYMRAVHYRLQDIESWPATVDFKAIESGILDCLEVSLKFPDSHKKPAYFALEALKRFCAAEYAAFSSMEDNKRAFDMLLGISKDIGKAEFSLITLSFDCLVRILSKLNKDSLPPSLKDEILNRLNNHSHIISYDIRMGLLLGLEHIMEIETHSAADEPKAEPVRINHNGGLFIEQLDKTADVMVELQDRWEKDIHTSTSDIAFDRMIKGIENEERLTPQQRVRFYMALVHLKTNSMAIDYHARLLKKNSAEECDPHKLLRSMTGIDLPRLKPEIRYRYSKLYWARLITMALYLQTTDARLLFPP